MSSLLRFNLSVRLEQVELFKKAQEIAERDREGVIAFFLKIPGVESYIVTHSFGNPQTLLEYAGKPRTLPIYRTCKHSSRALSATGLLKCKGLYFITPEICEYKNCQQSCYLEASP